MDGKSSSTREGEPGGETERREGRTSGELVHSCGNRKRERPEVGRDSQFIRKIHQSVGERTIRPNESQGEAEKTFMGCVRLAEIWYQILVGKMLNSINPAWSVLLICNSRQRWEGSETAHSLATSNNAQKAWCWRTAWRQPKQKVIYLVMSFKLNCFTKAIKVREAVLYRPIV